MQGGKSFRAAVGFAAHPPSQFYGVLWGIGGFVVGAMVSESLLVPCADFGSNGDNVV